MQRGNPMRESIAGNGPAAKESKADTILDDSRHRLALSPPQKPPVGKSHFGRTIEVQTDLSMVTMEQYSQGYNSKAFMNKTHEYIKDTVNNAD